MSCSGMTGSGKYKYLLADGADTLPHVASPIMKKQFPFFPQQTIISPLTEIPLDRKAPFTSLTNHPRG